MIIPVILMGSFSLVLTSMPIKAYQDFITGAFSGAFLDMLNFIYDATFGMVSLFITLSISICYIRSKGLRNNYVFVGAVTAVVGFFILSGVSIHKVNFEYMGVKGMFTAIFSAIVVSKIFVVIISNLTIPFRLYADGIDLEFNDAIIAMIPGTFIVSTIAILNYLVQKVFQVDCFHALFVRSVNSVFEISGRTFGSGLLFVLISSLLWFLGIHGSDVLEGTMEKVFSSGMKENINMIAQGKEPNVILTKQFFDLFVLIGGCGVTICLLISLFLVSRRNVNKNLARISAIPMLFNINELMVFGLPIIYNPYMLIPFVLTPIVCYIVSYMAFYLKLVPVITQEVAWTTPVFLSGYKATGSYKGSLLQFILIGIGVLIYIPFIRKYESAKIKSEMARMSELTEMLKKSERDNEDIKILSVSGIHGVLAKCLAADLQYAIEDEQIQLYYQLQYNDKLECIGAETLLRYRHPVHGMLYPPLVIKLAEEAGLLGKLERYMFKQAAIDYQKIKAVYHKKIKISVNVTISTILEPSFLTFLQKLKSDYSIEDSEMCIEITEQMAIKSDDQFEKVLNQVKKMGFLLAIDDFSMGSTSLKYLQKNQFDIVKLDGSIVTEMMTNDRSKEIISSIVYLANSLHFIVLAEYVESEEQIEKLKQIGCCYYQGYHFSKSVDINEFIEILNR